MSGVEPTCANCHRGILKENGRVACGAGFEEGPIWAVGYERTVAPILAIAMMTGVNIGMPDFPRADDMKGSQRGCKIFEERR